MPDIMMCTNIKCPLRVNCYRYRAINNPNYQSFCNTLKPDDSGECHYFWHIGLGRTDVLTVDEADDMNAWRYRE